MKTPDKTPGEFLANHYIEKGLDPDCRKDIDKKKRLLVEELAGSLPRKEPVPFIPFTMVMPMPYLGNRQVNPDLSELEVMFCNKNGYNI